MMKRLEPAYPADGVYVKLDEHGQVVLTTGSHVDSEARNRIVLEPEVHVAFVKWTESLVAEA